MYLVYMYLIVIVSFTLLTLFLLLGTYQLARAKHTVNLKMTPHPLPTEYLFSEHLFHLESMDIALRQEGFESLGDFELFLLLPPTSHLYYRRYYVHTQKNCIAMITLRLNNKRTSVLYYTSMHAVFEDNYEVLATTLPPPIITPLSYTCLYLPSHISFNQWIQEFLYTVEVESLHHSIEKVILENGLDTYLQTDLRNLYDKSVEKKQMKYDPVSQTYHYTYYAAFDILLSIYYYAFYKIPRLRKAGYIFGCLSMPSDQLQSPPSKFHFLRKVIIAIIILLMVFFIIWRP